MNTQLLVEEALVAFANKLIKYYQILNCSTNANLVAYHIKEILTQTLKEIEVNEEHGTVSN